MLTLKATGRIRRNGACWIERALAEIGPWDDGSSLSCHGRPHVATIGVSRGELVEYDEATGELRLSEKSRLARIDLQHLIGMLLFLLFGAFAVVGVIIYCSGHPQPASANRFTPPARRHYDRGDANPSHDPQQKLRP
jgi:hypothetical protein